MQHINQVTYKGHIIKIWTTKDGSRIVYDVINTAGALGLPQSIHWARSMSEAKRFIDQRNPGGNVNPELRD